MSVVGHRLVWLWDAWLGPRVPGSLWVWEARNLTKQGLDPHAGSGGGQGDRSRVACASAADPRVETQGF